MGGLDGCESVQRSKPQRARLYVVTHPKDKVSHQDAGHPPPPPPPPMHRFFSPPRSPTRRESEESTPVSRRKTPLLNLSSLEGGEGGGSLSVPLLSSTDDGGLRIGSGGTGTTVNGNGSSINGGGGGGRGQLSRSDQEAPASTASASALASAAAGKDKETPERAATAAAAEDEAAADAAKASAARKKSAFLVLLFFISTTMQVSEPLGFWGEGLVLSRTSMLHMVCMMRPYLFYVVDPSPHPPLFVSPSTPRYFSRVLASTTIYAMKARGISSILRLSVFPPNPLPRGQVYTGVKCVKFRFDRELAEGVLMGIGVVWLNGLVWALTQLVGEATMEEGTLEPSLHPHR